MKMKSCTIALDVDDTLASCVQAAQKRYCAETGITLSQYDVTCWADENVPWTKYFTDADFVATQPVLPGARDFVRALLNRGCDVLITTAVPLEMTPIREQWVRDNFPEINPDNILIGKRKDIFTVDIMIDDAAHNILNSRAKYPILMRKPWNQNVTGLMAANDFDDCLNLIDTIMRQNGFTPTQSSADVVCLVGPSGSGKHGIIRELREQGYVVPQIVTTNPLALQDYYRIITKQEFEAQKDAGLFAETTSYAGHYYGITTFEMSCYMDNRKANDAKLVIPIDVCGANALQRLYGDCVKTVYVKRSRGELVMSILRKSIPEEEKKLRILALDGETRNEELCDVSISNISVDDAVRQIAAI